ncbi:MAG: TRAP transporter large permease subunit, partial [Rhodospirillales bacterium]|nr:TRAP transporter large permease subunit [Rhodospirillales bacterium]
MIWLTLLILLSLLALGIPVAAAMGMCGLILEKIFTTMPLNLVLGEIAWKVSHDFILVAIPLFILLGE